MYFRSFDVVNDDCVVVPRTLDPAEEFADVRRHESNARILLFIRREQIGPTSQHDRYDLQGEPPVRRPRRPQ